MEVLRENHVERFEKANAEVRVNQLGVLLYVLTNKFQCFNNFVLRFLVVLLKRICFFTSFALVVFKKVVLQELLNVIVP